MFADFFGEFLHFFIFQSSSDIGKSRPMTSAGIVLQPKSFASLHKTFPTPLSVKKKSLKKSFINGLLLI
jgi:hypothetical protein